MSSIRFAVMCTGDTLELWQAQTIRRLLDEGGVEAALVINRAAGTRLARYASWLRRPDAWSTLLWRAYLRLWLLPQARSAQPVPLARVLPCTPVISCRPIARGRFGVDLRAKDLTAIRAANLDFILLFGFGILRGEILTVARHGVWSFHHDDPSVHRGLPPGFWAIYYGSQVNGIILQRLTARLDGGIILRRGWLKTIQHSYVRNLDSILYAGIHWPANVVADLRNGVAGYLADSPMRTDAPVRRRPTNTQTLRFFLCLLRGTAHRFFRAAFRNDQWAVGIVDAPIESFLEPDREKTVHWLPEPGPGAFLADPFAVIRDNRLDILAEEYDYRTGRGVIAAVELRPDGQPAARWRVMRMPVHLSYPFVIQHAGEIYCVPETAEAREAALYRAVSFPTRWEKAATLLPDVAAADSTIFRHEDRWWLLCTDRDADVDATLCAWYADELAGPWKPHASNPIKIDVRSSRPAGTPFRAGDRLYRPAQDCSRVYAGGIVIHQVTRLTPTEFSEEPVARVDPFPGSSYPAGTHTLSAAGNRTLIDAKREMFMLPALLAKLRTLRD